MSDSEYRINYTIYRIDDDTETEIGFGTSGESASIGAAVFTMTTDLDGRRWETRPGMPDPSEVD